MSVLEEVREKIEREGWIPTEDQQCRLDTVTYRHRYVFKAPNANTALMIDCYSDSTHSIVCRVGLYTTDNKYNRPLLVATVEGTEYLEHDFEHVFLESVL